MRDLRTDVTIWRSFRRAIAEGVVATLRGRMGELEALLGREQADGNRRRLFEEQIAALAAAVELLEAARR